MPLAESAIVLTRDQGPCSHDRDQADRNTRRRCAASRADAEYADTATVRIGRILDEAHGRHAADAVALGDGWFANRYVFPRSDQQNVELSMSAQPIPLRPDPGALRQAERRSFMRAAAAAVIGHRDRQNPVDVLRRSWASDGTSESVLKSVLKSPMAPTGTGDYPAAQSNVVLPLLAPSSASARLLSLATTFDMRGVSTVAIPWIAAGTIPPPAFVAEDAPAPLVNLTTAKSVLGPVKKLLILSAFTDELRDASVPSAASIISAALAIASERALDGALFSNNAASAVAPAGLLNGLVPIASAAGKGVDGLAADLGLLAAAIGQTTNADEAIYVTTPSLATKARILSGVKFNNPIFSSSTIPAGTVIAVAPAGMAVGYDGSTQIEISSTAALHFESATPGDIVGSGGTPSFPVKSAFQDAFSALRVKCRCAWIALPGSVAVLTGADW
jgi:hypothetical protein